MFIYISAPTKKERKKNSSRQKHQICVERWGDCNLPQINTWNKHKCHISISCFNDIISLCPLLLQWFNGTDWRSSATCCLSPNIHRTAVDGNKHYLAFSFAVFLEMCLKCVLHLDESPQREEVRVDEWENKADSLLPISYKKSMLVSFNLTLTKWLLL